MLLTGTALMTVLNHIAFDLINYCSTCPVMMSVIQHLYNRLMVVHHLNVA